MTSGDQSTTGVLTNATHPDPKISVIVPVLNDESRIINCLKAVFNQTISPYEVIVVDGHSTDHTTENVRKFPVKLIFEDYRTIGGARKVGVEEARGEYIAFTDSDCIPQECWLENLFKELDDGIVCVGGGVRNIGTGLWEESIALALDTFLGSANAVQDRVLEGKRIVRTVSGCNCIYRKKDIVTVGNFDTRLSINEDTDLNKRLRAFGQILYTPDAIVYHHQERTLGGFVRRMHFFGYGRGVNRLWDLQVAPPIAVVGILPMALVAPQVFSALIAIYIAIIGGYTLFLFAKARKPAYLFSIPVVFVLEHASYTFGFWKGTIEAISRRGTR